MKILAIADEESKYLWDYYEKSKLEGIDLIISCGDLDPTYLSFLVTLSYRFCMYTETMMENTNAFHLRAASALRIRSMSTKGCGYLDWEAPCATAQGRISIRSGR